MYYFNYIVYFLFSSSFLSGSTSRFSPSFMNLVNDNNLVLTDLSKISDVCTYTYSNIDANSFTWINHMVCSSAVDSLVYSCKVSYAYVSSDHKPLIVSFKDLLSIGSTGHPQTSIPNSIPDWSCADDSCIKRYQAVLCNELNKICIPKLRFDRDRPTDVSSCIKAIDCYYDAVISSVSVALVFLPKQFHKWQFCVRLE